MTEFLKRLIASIFGLSLLFAVLYYNGILINISIFILVFVGFFEINNALKKIEVNNNIIFYVIISIINGLELYFLNSIIISIFSILYITLYNLLFLRRNITTVSAMCFSMIYVILGFSSIVLIQNPIYIGLIFVIAFSTDTFAYLVGVTLGKHKLIPDVSPKKSVEGAIGGVLGATILSTLYLYFFNISITIFHIVLLILGSVLAQCGDLVASRIKRDTGVKDFGKLIPGHGGVLDRFDSVLLVAPVVYFLYNFLYL